MDKPAGILSRPAQRPAWLKKSPDLELDSRGAAVGDSFFLSIMEGMERLARGQVMGVRTDFEPMLLYPLLCEKGFEYWPEHGGDGDWNIQVRRRPQA